MYRVKPSLNRNQGNEKRETEALEFAVEYVALVNTLTPEFEQCQLETAKVRKVHLSTLEIMQNIYADYQITTSAEILFSLPEAKPFLMALNHKFNEIHSGKENKVYFNEIPDDGVVDSLKMRLQWQLMKNVLKPFFSATDADQNSDGLGLYQELEISSIELTTYSPVHAQRLMAHGAAAIK